MTTTTDLKTVSAAANVARVAEAEQAVLRIDAQRNSLFPDWREWLEFREMLIFLIVRDFIVRYRQTLVGVAWAVIQPLTTMVVFTIIFANVAQISTNGFPYPLFSFVALVPWTFFQTSLSMSTESLVGQAHLIRKVYFPRMFIPLSRILASTVDYAITLVVLSVLMLLYGHFPTWHTLWVVPLLTLLVILYTFGAGLWLSAMNVSYRDVRYLVPYALQVLLFVTPIAYPSNLVPAEIRWLYSFNPMVTVVDGFRWALLGQPPSIGEKLFQSVSGAAQGFNWMLITNPPPLAADIVISVLTTAVLVIGGLMFFHRVEGYFADIV